MADKKFSVITGGQPAVKPRHGGQLWRQVINEYEIDDAAGLEMLALACQQLDRAEECREQIDRDGLMIRTKTGPKDHPLLRSELSARGFVCRTLQRLGLNVEAIKPVGRPPAMAGFPTMSNRKITKRSRKLHVTKRAIDLFDDMEALEAQCTCPSPTAKIYDKCDACGKYRDQHNELHGELKLRPWQWPAYGNFEGNKPDVIERYRMLKAASDARKQAA